MFTKDRNKWNKKRVASGISIGFLLIIGAIYLSGLADNLFQTQPELTFRNVADSAGIHFKHFHGTRTNQIPEDMGSGAAWLDYDKDGWQDLFITNISGSLKISEKKENQSPAHSALYHNNGEGTFTDVTRQAGVIWHGDGMGVSAADYNNDGWTDLFLANRGHNVLFQNNGDGTFTDVTRKSGLYDFKGFWTNGSWGDYDRDGYLDLYVSGYLKYSNIGPNRLTRRRNQQVPATLNPGPFPPEPNLLFHNNGDGTFTERAMDANVMNTGGKSLSSSWCDFNNDGWPDLLVANDMTQNKLFMNKKDGTFLDIRTFSYLMKTRSSMGVAIGDVDQDMDMDIYITNWMSEENGLFINMQDQVKEGNMIRFRDMADAYGVGKETMPMVAWGTGFYDFDNDTRLDLFVTNGSTNPQKENPEKLEPMSNQMYWNKGLNKGYMNVTKSWGKALTRKLVGRGAAFADYDNDGDVDIFIVNHGGDGVLLKNDGGNRNNWLEISLTGKSRKPSPIGTRLQLYVNGTSFLREVGVQPSYLSGNSKVQHFGLNEYSKIDSLVIRWPDGTKQKFDDLPINEIVNIAEGKSDYTVLK